MDSVSSQGTILLLINAVLVVLGLGVGVFLIVLQIKLALRGIKALDIYIKKNQE